MHTFISKPYTPTFLNQSLDPDGGQTDSTSSEVYFKETLSLYSSQYLTPFSNIYKLSKNIDMI